MVVRFDTAVTDLKSSVGTGRTRVKFWLYLGTHGGCVEIPVYQTNHDKFSNNIRPIGALVFYCSYRAPVNAASTQIYESNFPIVNGQR